MNVRHSAPFAGVGFVILALAMIVAGCGSSDGTSTTTALTKADFVTQANAICDTGNKAAGSALHRGMSGAQVEAAVTNSFAPAVQTQIDGIKALAAPAGDESTVTNMLSLAQADLDKVKADPGLVADPNLFSDFAKVAHPYGLTSCAPDS